MELDYNNKCSNCNDYYVLNDKQYCSNCELVVKYRDVDLSGDEILMLPASDFKREKISGIIEEIYEAFQTIMNIPNVLITNSQFKILMNLCFDKTPEEIYDIFKGKKDFVACVLRAKQADKLFSAISDDKGEINYKYIHAIAPFILDVWNCNTRDGVFVCYYKDIEQPNKCPHDLLKLYKIWSEMKKDAIRY